jgi:uncharacterized protein YjbI with pentapeptide repeats
MVQPKQVFRDHDFSGQDLAGKDFSRSILIRCNFDKCDLTKTDFSYSDLTGASFRDSVCLWTNFMMAKMQYSKFFPKEAYGCTFTMSCATFKNMEISKLQWYCYRFFSLLMLPETDRGQDLRENDIKWMGVLYLKFKDMFARKEL